MRYSKLFGKTVKKAPTDAKTASHRLLYQAGFIRESTAGRYYFLPLGLRVQQKVIKIVKEEMDHAGAQEMFSPIFHPLYLWQETNRDKEAKFELSLITDRRGAEFVPGGTAEEMFVDVVRKFQLSYKDLPMNLYQFSPKFRDELRARGGLLRVREFVMKDAYSFHRDEEDFKKEYQNMWNTYARIVERVGLEAFVVSSDNGYIGGDYSHEFQVKAEAGEDTIFYVPSKKLFFNKEVAPTKAPPYDQKGQRPQPIKEVEGKGIIGVEELAKYLKIPVELTTKTILFETDKGEVVAAAVRGGYTIDEVKLRRIIHCRTLTLLDAEKLKKLTGAEVGYAGLINLPKSVHIVMDDSMQGRINFEMGANRTNYHSINVNFGRDLEEPKEFYDFKEAKEGDIYPDTGEVYEVFRGIEVGNIFQLGYHYSKQMKGATFIDRDGKEKPYYMGCYGYGIGRTIAAVVETHHDERGIVWPESVAPYQVHLIGLDLNDEVIKLKVHKVYKELQENNIEVLFDDREGISAGEKFADADLIGIPHRVVVSRKTGDKIEHKLRTEKQTSTISINELISKL